MYVITILTPANKNPNKMVKTYYVGQTLHRGVSATEWDEDKNFAFVFANKLDAKKVRSKLRKLQGSESAKIELLNKFSKN